MEAAGRGPPAGPPADPPADQPADPGPGPPADQPAGPGPPAAGVDRWRLAILEPDAVVKPNGTYFAAPFRYERITR